MSDKSEAANTNHSSSWWGFAQSAWTTIQDTAKDFQESIKNENEETIENLKQNINQQKITHQISNATNTINTFLKSINNENDDNNESNEPNKINIQSSPKEAQIVPKPFEKEKATYSSDPTTMSQHKEKYKVFLEKELNLKDDEICLKGRELLKINSAIRAYFECLIPNDLDEITFWKRYFYRLQQNELRQRLISKHTSDDFNIDNNDEHKLINDDDEEPSLGDCENAKVNGNKNENIHNSTAKKLEINTNDNEEKKDNKNIVELPSNTSSNGSGGKFSETSWSNLTNPTNSNLSTNITNTDESITKIIINNDDDDNNNDSKNKQTENLIIDNDVNEEDKNKKENNMENDGNNSDKLKDVNIEENDDKKDVVNDKKQSNDIEHEENESDGGWADWD